MLLSMVPYVTQHVTTVAHVLIQMYATVLELAMGVPPVTHQFAQIHAFMAFAQHLKHAPASQVGQEPHAQVESVHRAASTEFAPHQKHVNVPPVGLLSIVAHQFVHLLAFTVHALLLILAPAIVDGRGPFATFQFVRLDA